MLQNSDREAMRWILLMVFFSQHTLGNEFLDCFRSRLNLPTSQSDPHVSKDIALEAAKEVGGDAAATARFIALEKILEHRVLRKAVKTVLAENYKSSHTAILERMDFADADQRRAFARKVYLTLDRVLNPSIEDLPKLPKLARVLGLQDAQFRSLARSFGSKMREDSAETISAIDDFLAQKATDVSWTRKVIQESKFDLPRNFRAAHAPGSKHPLSSSREWVKPAPDFSILVKEPGFLWAVRTALNEQKGVSTRDMRYILENLRVLPPEIRASFLYAVRNNLEELRRISSSFGTTKNWKDTASRVGYSRETQLTNFVRRYGQTHDELGEQGILDQLDTYLSHLHKENRDEILRSNFLDRWKAGFRIQKEMEHTFDPALKNIFHEGYVLDAHTIEDAREWLKDHSIVKEDEFLFFAKSLGSKPERDADRIASRALIRDAYEKVETQGFWNTKLPEPSEWNLPLEAMEASPKLKLAVWGQNGSGLLGEDTTAQLRRLPEPVADLVVSKEVDKLTYVALQHLEKSQLPLSEESHRRVVTRRKELETLRNLFFERQVLKKLKSTGERLLSRYRTPPTGTFVWRRAGQESEAWDFDYISKQIDRAYEMGNRNDAAAPILEFKNILEKQVTSVGEAEAVEALSHLLLKYPSYELKGSARDGFLDELLAYYAQNIVTMKASVQRINKSLAEKGVPPSIKDPPDWNLLPVLSERLPSVETEIKRLDPK